MKLFVHFELKSHLYPSFSFEDVVRVDLEISHGFMYPFQRMFPCSLTVCLILKGRHLPGRSATTQRRPVSGPPLMPRRRSRSCSSWCRAPPWTASLCCWTRWTPPRAPPGPRPGSSPARRTTSPARPPSASISPRSVSGVQCSAGITLVVGEPSG